MVKAAAAPVRIIDTMPDFWSFWEVAATLGRDEQAALFREMVIDRHPELYGASVMVGREDAPLESVLTNKLQDFLSDAPGIVGPMRRLWERLVAELPAHADAFLRTFPDFSYEGAVYLLVSLHSFMGATRKVDGRPSLLFGPDEMARRHGVRAPLTVFFDHELFHVYHARVFPGWDREPSALWHSLWSEGLATYVTEVLDPGVPTAHLLGGPADLEDRARPLLPRLARELLAKLDSVDPADYADFFLGGSKRQDIPWQSGYYVGLFVARVLAGGVELREAARWGGAHLRERIGRALRDVAETGGSLAIP